MIFELKHVKAWLTFSTDHRKDKTVFDLKQRCFIPGGARNLLQTKFCILKLFKVYYGGHVTRDVIGLLNMIS